MKARTGSPRGGMPGGTLLDGAGRRGGQPAADRELQRPDLHHLAAGRPAAVRRGARPATSRSSTTGCTSQFLDIHDLTTEDGERGLLSMAFDPNYAKNGLFYVFYTGTAAADGQDGPRPRRRVPCQLESERRQRREPPAGPDDHAPERRSRQPQRRASSSSAGTASSTSPSGTAATGGSTAPNLGSPQRQDPADRPARARPRAPTRSRRATRTPPRAPRATRSGPPASATRGGSRSTHATGDLIIGDVGEGSLGGDRPGAGASRHRAGRQLRLAGLRGLRRELSRGRRLRSSPTRTATPAATSPTAARSLAATSTAAPRSLSSPAATSTPISAPASCARSSSAFRSPAATEPRARPAP